MFPYFPVDLSHTLNEQSPSWDGGCGFTSHNLLDYTDCTTEVKFRVQELRMHAGIGTHIDAPSHINPQGIHVDQIPIENLIRPCVMIDLSQKAYETYTVSVEEIKEFEKAHGMIPQKTIILIRTGWDRYWPTDKYRNNYRFPSVSQEAARLLVERRISGLVIDTLSPDRPDSGYPVHKALLQSGIWIAENATHLEKVSPTGSYCLALPIKLTTTESPMRLIALAPR